MTSILASPLVKQPSEKRRYAVDFTNLLSTGDSISTGSTVARVRARAKGSTVLAGGSTLSSTAALPAAATGFSYSGNQILFWISGGLRGKTYHIEAVVGTTGGSILEGDGILRVGD